MCVYRMCVYIYIYIYTYTYVVMPEAFDPESVTGAAGAAGAAPELVQAFGRGDDTVWKPSSSSNLYIQAFRAYPLVEIRQTAPSRAIRGSSISVSSTLHPL